MAQIWQFSWRQLCTAEKAMKNAEQISAAANTRAASKINRRSYLSIRLSPFLFFYPQYNLKRGKVNEKTCFETFF